MINNKSLSTQLTLYTILTFTVVLLLGLGLNYFFTRQTLLAELQVRAGNLVDQISYAIEVLEIEHDIFPIHRVVEQTASLEDVAVVAVINRDGMVVSHDNKQQVGQTMTDPLLVKAFETEQRMTEFTADRYVVADPLHGESYSLQYHSDVIGVIWIEMDLASVQSALFQQYIFIALIMIGVLLLLGAAMLFILRRTVIQRLHYLTAGLDSVSAGNLSFSLPVPASAHSHDEISALINHFNRMTGSLQEQITQKLQAQNAQIESSRRLAQVLDAAGDAIITINAEYLITSFNQGAEQVFGYRAIDLINQPLSMLLPPEFRQVHPRYLDRFAAGSALFEPYNQRITLAARRKNGQVFPAEASISKLHLNGSLTMTAILRDVTVQKQTEADLKFRSQLEQLIAQISTHFISLPPGALDVEITRAIQLIGEFVGVDRSYVFLFTGQVMNNTHEWCAAGILPQKDNLQALPLSVLPWWVAKLNKFENISIPRVADLPPEAATEKEILEAQDIQSVMVVPLVAAQTVMGFLGFDAVVSERVWSDDTISLLRVVGNSIANALNRKRADLELRQSEINFRTFFDAVEDFLFILDQAGNIQYFNAAVTHRLGYSAADILGRHVLLVHPPERRDEAGRIVQAMLAGATESCPVPLITPTGQQVPVETRIYHGVWDGQPALFGISKDLSKLKASEEKFARAFEANPTLMALSSIEDDHFVEVNSTFVQATGYSRAEIIGQTSAGLNLFHNPAQRQAALTQMSQQGHVRNAEIDIVTKNGEIRHGSFSADIINLQDGPCLLTVMNDITERKKAEADLRQSEARNRAMLNAIPDLMFRFDRQGKVLDFKSSDHRLLLMPPEQFIGRTITHLLPPEVAHQAQKAMSTLLQTGELQLFRYQLDTIDGRHNFEARLVLIDAQEVLAIVRDITEEARLEQMKTDFINRASHELRTPLTTAIMMVDLIREGGEAEELAEYWRILQAELQRQRDLIEDMLTVGRLESGAMRVTVHPMSLSPILEACLHSLEPVLGAKLQTLNVTIAPALPPVQADENSLTRVFTNLLNNAIKFTPDGGQIGLTATVLPSGQVEVTVSDTGIGVPPEDLPNLFRRFFRASNATRQEIPGSGVGLYMVKSILEEMDGQVEVASTLGQGTTFKVRLKPAPLPLT